MQIIVRRWHLNIVRAILIAFTLFSVCSIIVVVIQCQPISYFWTRYSGGSGSCISPAVLAYSTYAHGALSAVIDWTLGTLPIFIVRDLRMDLRTKISTAVILGLGAM